MKCPLCQSSKLSLQTYKLKIAPIPAHSTEVILNTMECLDCGEQTEPYELSVANDHKVANAKLAWLANNLELPGAAEGLVKSLRKSLGLDQKKFAELVGATGNAISKYEQGSVQPSSMAMKLFSLLAWSEESRAELIRHSTPNSNTVNWEQSRNYPFSSPMPNILPACTQPSLKTEHVSEWELRLNIQDSGIGSGDLIVNSRKNYISIFDNNSSFNENQATNNLGQVLLASSRMLNSRTLSSVH